MRKQIFACIFSVSVAAILIGSILFAVFALPLLSDADITEWLFWLGCILLFLLAAFALSFWVAGRLAGKFTKPINEFDFEHPQKDKIYPELTPFVARIDQQNQRIKKQMLQIEAEHEKQDRMRSEFTANVSHELKTPLTSISGFAEIIGNGIAKEEDIKRFAGNIYNEAQRLIVLIDDIIKLSELDSFEMANQFEYVDLYAVSENVAKQLEAAAKKKNITVSLSGSHLKIKGIEQILYEMIYNLCDNAVKYNHDNGSVSVKIMQCVDGIELTVADTGIGIPKDEIDRVCERFYRVNKSHSKEIGGTGLGLSIVKHAVACHDASLSIDTELGKGTTVRILF